MAIILLLVFLVTYEPPSKEYQEPVPVNLVQEQTRPFEPKPEIPPENMEMPFTPGAEPGPAPDAGSVNGVEAPLEPGSADVEHLAGMGPATQEDVDGIEIQNDVRSPLILRTEMSSRSGRAREKALTVYAGSMGVRTETCVVKALDWLKTQQQVDGSWGPNRIAMTGLSLLTFLAHGETTSSTNYSQTVENAIRFLLAKQRADGTFIDVGAQGDPYEHGIATYAMCEAYGLTRIPGLKPAMENAVQVILNGQQEGGGWDYRYSQGGRRDTSIAGWQIQALKAARIAGAENPGIQESLAKAADDMKRARDPVTGKFHYTDQTSQTSDSITGVAVLCLELIGQGDSKEARGGLAALAKALCKWEAPPDWALYGWYYITQAKFHAGGPEWDAWNKRFAKSYTGSQNRDGSWISPREDEQKYGPTYSTALAALTLQVYYRLLPTYKSVEIDKKIAFLSGEGDVTVAVQ